MTTLAQRKSEIKYDISQSPLYKLQSKKKLASLLNLSSPIDLKIILRLEDPYRKFSVFIKGKQRQVEVPSKTLLPIHNRIFTLLKRIQMPEYLHSGIKGRSYLSNARVHMGQKEAYSLDIKKFYPSVHRANVSSFFRKTMKCSTDVAGILADLTTCEGHIPTGSALSQILAYLACKDMFDEIFEACVKANLRMTCYVDDLTFSGEKITKRWIHECIKPIITKSGMRSHKDKYFRAGRAKEITGVIVDGNSLKVCNRMHKSIHELLIKIAETEDIRLLNELYDTLVGKLSAAGQIDEKFKRGRIKASTARRQLLNKSRTG